MSWSRWIGLLAAALLCAALLAAGLAEAPLTDAVAAELADAAPGDGLAEADPPGNGLADVETAPGNGLADADAAPGAPGSAFDEAEAGYAGVWVPFEDGFRLYLPDCWACRGITEEQAGAGIFYLADNGGGDDIVGDTAMGVAVSYARADGPEGPDGLVGWVGAAGLADARAVSLNGISAVAFEGAAGGYRGVAFRHPAYPGYVLAVYVSPVGGAGTPERALGDAILASVSPWSVGGSEATGNRQ